MTFGIFISIVVAIVGLQFFLYRRRYSIIQRLAERMQGRFNERGSMWSPQGYYIEGVSGPYGATLLIEIVRESRIGRRRGKVHMFTFNLRHGSNFRRMRITSKGLFSNLANMAGVATGQEIGRESIDSKYNLYGSLEELSRFLRPSVERHLHEIFKHDIDEFVIDGLILQVKATDLFYNDEAFFHLFESLAAIAKVHDRQVVNPPIQLQSKARSQPKVRLNTRNTSKRKGPKCPCCQETIDLRADSYSTCQRCQSLQHDHCLEQTGGCVSELCGGLKSQSRQQLRT